MVLGKLTVPGRPACFDLSIARAYYVCSGCGMFCHFFSPLSSLSSSLGDGLIETETLSQRAIKPKQPTNK